MLACYFKWLQNALSTGSGLPCFEFRWFILPVVDILGKCSKATLMYAYSCWMRRRRLWPGFILNTPIYWGSILIYSTSITVLTLWLWLADKAAEQTFLLGTDGRPTNSIRLLWHIWKIARPRDYQPLKDENLCLSILDLLHKSGNWVCWFFTIKILYLQFCIHLPCTGN